MICAAKNGHTECVRLLLKTGADPDVADNVRVIEIVALLHRTERFS